MSIDFGQDGPTAEQLAYRNSEEFLNHDFGRWSADGTPIIWFDLKSGRTREYCKSPEDERILLKAGYSLDDFDYLCVNSPKAKIDKQLREMEQTMLRQESRHNRENGISPCITKVTRFVLHVLRLT